MLVIRHRLGMIVSGCAFIDIKSAPNIKITASDLNAIIIYILSKPTLFKGESFFNFCLPGVANDGYMHFFSKFITPNIGIIFASASKEDSTDFAEKANSITKFFEDYKFVPQITKSIYKNYVTKSCILPRTFFPYVDYGEDIQLAIVKNIQLEQITTLNLPAFTRIKKHKLQLEKIADMYQRIEDPRDPYMRLEHVHMYEKDNIAMVCNENSVIIVLGKGTVNSKRMIMACYEVNRIINKKPDKYFITSYT